MIMITGIALLKPDWERKIPEDNSASQTDPPTDIKVEVYHFHATQQCYSCKTVGSLAEKTVDNYFKEELESGRIIFSHVNIDLAQNREIVEKYQPTGSSLWIGTYLDGNFSKEENTRVWYKINNEEDYLTYLQGLLEERLSGDLG